MRIPIFLGSLSLLVLTAGCSQAQSDQAAETSTDQAATTDGAKEKGKGKKNKGKTKSKDAAAVAGLRRVGSLKGVVPESSSLCPAPQPGTYYSFGDGGNPSILYQFDGTGKLLGTLELGATNDDWESLSRDDQGNYYLGNCGNNESRRRDLSIYRLRPDQPNQLQQISFRYPDQTEFPPSSKKAQNFDCEAIVWHAGRVYLFTKDRAGRTSKVYSVPAAPGDYEAQLVTSLAIAGEVTDAALRPDGRRLVLLGREELFILDGSSWQEILKATPRQISLAGAGQTEGCTFKDANTLLISTEQGGLFEYKLP
ncbi:hypothetical protein [uncultured Hymenobacter sp.]|uniref:hypothetical protein n=1 Tax=uncultured Hymenobacter sp. TaxID=170016 RepID=UPI0035C9CD23